MIMGFLISACVFILPVLKVYGIILDFAFVRVRSCVCTYVCLLPDNGSLNVIRRSLMLFGNPVSFPTRSELMAKPLFSFTSTPNECLASANFFDLPYLCKASLTQGSYLYPISAKFSTNKAVLRCGLSDPALSIRVRTFHAPIFKGITFVFFLCFRPLKGIPADRGYTARGIEAGNCLGHLF